jgi:nucleotide-binding universal stress UspA family protein
LRPYLYGFKIVSFKYLDENIGIEGFGLRQFIGKILVAVDGSNSCLRAMQVAAAVAKKFHSQLTVVHVISHDFMHPELKAHYQFPSLVLEELDKSYQKTGRKILTGAEEFFKEEKIDVKSKLVRAEDPAEKILEIIKESDYDLLILGNVSEIQARRFSLGSVAEKISLYAKIPVLITKKKTKIRKLLVAVDGSANADKALRYAVQFCQPFKAGITLLTVEEVSLFELEPKVTKKVGEQILADAVAKVRDLTFDSRFEIGDPATVILKVAKQEDCDLIVLGSRGLSSVKRFLLGSVSADVSMYAHRSVLIVR